MSICLQPAAHGRAWLWLGFLCLNCFALDPRLQCSSWRVPSSQAFAAHSRPPLCCWGSRPLELGTPQQFGYGDTGRVRVGIAKKVGVLGKWEPEHGWRGILGLALSLSRNAQHVRLIAHFSPSFSPSRKALYPKRPASKSFCLNLPWLLGASGIKLWVGGPATGLLHTATPRFIRNHPQASKSSILSLIWGDQLAPLCPGLGSFML